VLPILSIQLYEKQQWNLKESTKVELKETASGNNGTLGLDAESTEMFDKILQIGKDNDTVLAFIQSSK
jgi:hypothetical protein